MPGERIKDHTPIASLIDRILTESGYEAALIGESLGDRKRANARKLVRMARRFDEQGGFTLADFVARLRADHAGGDQGGIRPRRPTRKERSSA